MLQIIEPILRIVVQRVLPPIAAAVGAFVALNWAVLHSAFCAGV